MHYHSRLMNYDHQKNSTTAKEMKIYLVNCTKLRKIHRVSNNSSRIFNEEKKRIGDNNGSCTNSQRAVNVRQQMYPKKPQSIKTAHSYIIKTNVGEGNKNGRSKR